jgi:hypothetical protein
MRASVIPTAFKKITRNKGTTDATDATETAETETEAAEAADIICGVVIYNKYSCQFLINYIKNRTYYNADNNLFWA